MEQSEERDQSMKSANQVSIYKSLLVGILIGVVGVFGRFAFDSTALSIACWAILLIGTIWSFRAVFKILDAK
ncbi:MAG: hypothetical protein WC622_00860 [Pedobacter sp.]|jgi:hypothetical protein|uniref:hypothetical protein n=1 Tax=Pedobacter sp. TaxID=1411316 RepID=UPI0035684C01